MAAQQEGSVRQLLEQACKKLGSEDGVNSLLKGVPDEVLGEWARLVGEQQALAERQRCANLMKVSSAELMLMGGEMTAQELRTVKAVLAQRAFVMLQGQRVGPGVSERWG